MTVHSNSFCFSTQGAAATASLPSSPINMAKGVSDMHDKASFHKCSQRIADEAQRIVRAAAAPVQAGDTIKAQLRRAYQNLGMPPFWRVRAAWYGEADSWSAQALEDLRARYRAFSERQERRGLAEAASQLIVLKRTVEALRADDPNIHRHTIAALERAISSARLEDSAVA